MEPYGHVIHIFEQMIRFFTFLVHKTEAKSFTSTTHVKLRSHPKLKRPNKALQSYFKSNPTKTLFLFRDLLGKNNPSIDSYSLLYVIKACIQKALATEGKQFHALLVKFGYEPIIFLQTSLINMYSVTANLADARRMFDEIPKKNVVCWTALISAYVDNQEPNGALQMFRQMQMENVEPDQVTLTVALSACADLGALDMGEWIHACIYQKRDLNVDLGLKNALINMYAKCGDVQTARGLFDNIKRKDVTTWTSMIVGYAIHGQAGEALRLFAAINATRNNRQGRIIPNDITFLGVLMACSHAGMLEEGKRYFKSMTEEFGLKPRLSHYGCVVDLFCRLGMLKEAYKFMLAMPVKPNAVIWRTLLGACSVHGNLDLAAVAHHRLLELEESLVGDDVAMSNIYAAKGMWDKKLMLRDEMKQRRTPGHSSIEVESCIHEFGSADNDHLLASEIYNVLGHLAENMRTCSYTSEFSILSET